MAKQDSSKSNSSRRKRLKTCAICGAEVTDLQTEHLPPRKIFIENLPHDTQLVTVKACADCNNGNSDYDNRFRDCLAMQLSKGGINPDPRVHQLIEKTGRSISGNNRYEKRLMQDSHRAWLRTEKGLYIRPVTVGKWDNEAFDNVINRMTKALYFKSFKKPAPKDFVAKPGFHGDNNPKILDLMYNHRTRHSEETELIDVADGAFRYRPLFAPEEDRCFNVVYHFYGMFLASGQLMQADLL